MMKALGLNSKDLKLDYGEDPEIAAMMKGMKGKEILVKILICNQIFRWW